MPWRPLGLAAALLLLAFLFLAAHSPGTPPQAMLTVLVATPAGAVIPGGNVVIDGRRTGPPGQALSVPAGRMGVRFEQTGYTSETKYVDVAQGAALRVDLVARPLPAKLSLASNPGSATVSVAGRILGRTPVTLELLPQRHVITLTLDGYLRKTLDLNLDPGETRTVSADLTAAAAPAPAPRPAREPPPQPAPVFQPASFDRGVTAGQVPLFAGPSRGSNLLSMVPPETEVAVMGQVVAEEAWLQVRAGNAQGFTPAGEAIEGWESWARRHAGSGPFDSVTPDMRAVVGSGFYPLFGVRPPPQAASSRTLASQREALRRELGGKFVTCVPSTTTRFVCTIARDGDLAGYYLFNGAAVVGEGASAYDVELQDKARARRKGIWAE